MRNGFFLAVGFAALSVGGFGVWYASNAFRTVDVGFQAVVVERGMIVEVLDPGLHRIDPIFQQVTFYPKNFEQRTRFTEAVSFGDCLGEATLFYNIADVEALHRSGGDLYDLSAIRADLQAQPVALVEATPGQLELAPLAERIEAAVPEWLGFLRVQADLGDCAPEEPVVERIETPLPPPATFGALGEERTALFGIELRLADGAVVILDGAQATWTITDADRAAACFGSRSPDPYIEVVVSLEMRVTAAPMGLPDLATFGETLFASPGDGLVQFSENCAVAFNAVDFSEATMTQIVERVVE